jgi:hypothetical protein
MQKFYDLTEEEREAITMRAMGEKRSVMERWEALGPDEASGWDQRAAAAARLLADQASVADLGCGTMLLEKHLDPAVRYFPIDIVPRDERTIVCDFNREVSPKTDAESAAILGLLEYLHYPEAFLANLIDQYSVAVISYCTTDAPKPLLSRRSHAWVNDYNCKQLEQIFIDAGWEIFHTEMIDVVQQIWKLRVRTHKSA